MFLRSLRDRVYMSDETALVAFSFITGLTVMTSTSLYLLDKHYPEITRAPRIQDMKDKLERIEAKDGREVSYPKMDSAADKILADSSKRYNNARDIFETPFMDVLVNLSNKVFNFQQRVEDMENNPRQRRQNELIATHHKNHEK